MNLNETNQDSQLPRFHPCRYKNNKDKNKYFKQNEM